MSARVKKPEEMTPREQLEYAVQNILHFGEEIKSYLLVCGTNKYRQYSMIFEKGRLALHMAHCAKADKDLRRELTMAVELLRAMDRETARRMCREIRVSGVVPLEGGEA